jgi:hypothetical protein
MGLFFERTVHDGAPAEVTAGAGSGAGVSTGTTTFNRGRFFVALAMFAALVMGGVIADVGGHYASSTALYGFAGTVFGVVAAFIGTEKSASG